jgi:hypothetical protein
VDFDARHILIPSSTMSKPQDQGVAKEMVARVEPEESPLNSPVEGHSSEFLNAKDSATQPDVKASHSSSSLSTSSGSNGTDSIEEDDVGRQDDRLSRHTSRVFGEQLSKKQTGVSVATNATSDPAFEVDWEADDAGNPQNWPGWRKAFTIFGISWATMTVYGLILPRCIKHEVVQVQNED